MFNWKDSDLKLANLWFKNLFSFFPLHRNFLFRRLGEKLTKFRLPIKLFITGIKARISRRLFLANRRLNPIILEMFIFTRISRPTSFVCFQPERNFLIIQSLFFLTKSLVASKIFLLEGEGTPRYCRAGYRSRSCCDELDCTRFSHTFSKTRELVELDKRLSSLCNFFLWFFIRYF